MSQHARALAQQTWGTTFKSPEPEGKGKHGLGCTCNLIAAGAGRGITRVSWLSSSRFSEDTYLKSDRAGHLDPLCALMGECNPTHMHINHI